jgi:hypothetical protein
MNLKRRRYMDTRIIMLLVILTGFCNSNAQSLKAISQSGYEESYSVSNNLKITFDSTAFVFSKGGAIIKKWGYGDLRKIVYVNGSTSINEDIPSVGSDKISVYPQPAKEQISISFHIPNQCPIHIHMYSVEGTLIHSYAVGVMQQGHNITTIPIPTSLPNGSYILYIQGSTFSYSIPIIHSEGQ